MLPHYYKKIGVGILILSIIFWITSVVNDLNESYTQMATFVFLAGMSFVVFSKEKNETPLVAQIKYELFFQTFAGCLLFFIIITAVNVGLSDQKWSVKTFLDYLQKVTILKFSVLFLVLFYINFRQKFTK